MKYVFLGNIAPEWIGRQKERLKACRAKADKLGIKFDAICYTQGVYDFVDIVEAKDVKSALAFSLWYAKQGYGKIATLPAFDEGTIEKALESV
ncbi:MAG: GYD domain-containing protein [Rhodospirillales bacterium]